MTEIQYYPDGNAARPTRTEAYATVKEARKAAARMLGHNSLRGASTWDRYQGGDVYQFGPRSEMNDRPFVVIVDDDSAEAA